MTLVSAVYCQTANYVNATQYEILLRRTLSQTPPTPTLLSRCLLTPGVRLRQPKFSQPPPVARESGEPARTADFVRHQAQLQTEARLALAQAKQMARMQMEIERQSRNSPISDVVRVAFQKVGGTGVGDAVVGTGVGRCCCRDGWRVSC